VTAALLALVPILGVVGALFVWLGSNARGYARERPAQPPMLKRPRPWREPKPIPMPPGIAPASYREPSPPTVAVICSSCGHECPVSLRVEANRRRRARIGEP